MAEALPSSPAQRWRVILLEGVGGAAEVLPLLDEEISDLAEADVVLLDGGDDGFATVRGPLDASSGQRTRSSQDGARAGPVAQQEAAVTALLSAYHSSGMLEIICERYWAGAVLLATGVAAAAIGTLPPWPEEEEEEEEEDEFGAMPQVVVELPDWWTLWQRAAVIPFLVRTEGVEESVSVEGLAANLAFLEKVSEGRSNVCHVEGAADGRLAHGPCPASFRAEDAPQRAAAMLLRRGAAVTVSSSGRVRLVGGNPPSVGWVGATWPPPGAGGRTPAATGTNGVAARWKERRVWLVTGSRIQAHRRAEAEKRAQEAKEAEQRERLESARRQHQERRQKMEQARAARLGTPLALVPQMPPVAPTPKAFTANSPDAVNAFAARHARAGGSATENGPVLTEDEARRCLQRALDGLHDGRWVADFYLEQQELRGGIPMAALQALHRPLLKELSVSPTEQGYSHYFGALRMAARTYPSVRQLQTRVDGEYAPDKLLQRLYM
ncbi:hypothetical protein CYMTET_24516 [Cymbomonas tetramitiformis]|uniref:Uncharacterized protein n=1 Tax=Cymbomonas tetramitiformis TaxID=36881 RepID=A0AAE0FW71_9CHLO|nr:hypothetical protein CYMTET_24516 [Cymbomonas tetramitiformis]